MEDPALKSDEFLRAVAAAQSPEELEQTRIKLLGRNGEITALMRGLGQLPAERRRDAGARLNTLRDAVRNVSRIAWEWSNQSPARDQAIINGLIEHELAS